MAFPVSESRTAARNTNGTSWTLAGLVPAHASGDVLLLAIGVDGVPTLTPTAVGGVAWTNITDTGNVDNKLAVWWLRATSNQAADADLVVTSSVTEQGVARCWRLQGVHSTTAPAVGTAAVATSSVPNPPLLNPAGWDVEDTWWLALVNTDGAVTATAFPSNMDTATGFTDISGGGTGAGLHTCRLESAVASLDPNTFTISGSETWVAQTVAVRPAQHIGSLAATQAADTLAAAGTFAEGGTTGTLAVTQAGDTLAAAGTVTAPPVTVLTQGSNATDATSFATASVTPAADAVVWLACAIRHATLQPSTPTVSGCGLTWASVGEIYFDESTTRTKLFVFRGTAASPSSGAVTMNVGTTHGGAVWQVIQATDVNNPSSPVVQSVAADSAEALNTGLTLTLPSAVTSGNRVLAFLATFDNTAAQVTEEAGYIDLGMAGPEAGESNLGVTTMWRADGEQTPSWTWAVSALNGGIAVEFAPAGVGISGTLAATQAGDMLAASGVLGYAGALTVTQADQTLAAAGTSTAPGVSGTLAVTQAAQTLAAAGVLGYTGTLAVSQGGDTLAAAGAVTGLVTYVRVSQVYLQAPAGAAGTTGTLSVTQAAQTLAAAGTFTPPAVTGTLSVTQAAQTLAAAGGTAQHIGALAVTQANQTLAAAGILRYIGALAQTQAANTLTASGVLRYTGTLSQTQAGQTLAASGTVTSLGIAGSLAVTQADQTLAASGVLRYTGTLAQTQADQTVAASGWIRVTGTLTVTQAAQTLAAAGGTAQNIGTVAVTQANQTLAAAGQLRYTAALAATQADQTVAASGVQRYTGTVAAVQAPNTLTAAGTVTIIGTAGNVDVTQANQTLAAVGNLPGYIAFGVNVKGRSSSPNGRGATTPGGEARGRTLVGVNVR